MLEMSGRSQPFPFPFNFDNVYDNRIEDIGIEDGRGKQFIVVRTEQQNFLSCGDL